jgi:hypothetical protein
MFSHERFAMDQMVSDSNCCVGRRPGIFDHRLGAICFALGRANRRRDCVAATYSTFKSHAGRISDSNSHSFAYTKGNTYSYSKPYAVTNASSCGSASPASTPPPIDEGSARGRLVRARGTLTRL